MSSAEKAAEQSMEEILASIRKIISEEPAGQRAPGPVVGPGAGSGSAGGDSSTAGAGSKDAAASATPKSPLSPPAVDDVLDDLVTESVPVRAETPPARPEPSVPSWLFPRTAAAASPSSTAKSPAPADPLLGREGGTPRDAAKPLLGAGREETSGGKEDTGRSPGSATAPGRGADLGALVPGRLDASLPRPEPGPKLDIIPERRQPTPGLTPASVPSAARAGEPAIPHISFGPPGTLASDKPGAPDKSRFGGLAPADSSAPRSVATAPREGSGSLPAAEAKPFSSTPGGVTNGLAAGAPPIEAPRPGRSETAGRPTDGSAPNPSLQAPSVAAGSMSAPPTLGPMVPAPSLAAKPATDPVRTALSPTRGLEKQMPLQSNAGPAPGAVASSGIAVPLQAPVVPAGGSTPAQGAGAAGKPPGAGSPSGPAINGPAGTPVIAAGSEPTKTLEDTVAELLRPMLRQWLDANLPRIVEKALRVELAEAAKKKH
jgi:cell pole-organizing protein PopZ